MRLTYLLKYKQYNAGHVPDLIKPGDSAWGTDWLGESKVPSPLRASAPPPGCQRMVGALDCSKRLAGASWSPSRP